MGALHDKNASSGSLASPSLPPSASNRRRGLLACNDDGDLVTKDGRPASLAHFRMIVVLTYLTKAGAACHVENRVAAALVCTMSFK